MSADSHFCQTKGEVRHAVRLLLFTCCCWRLDCYTSAEHVLAAGEDLCWQDRIILRKMSSVGQVEEATDEVLARIKTAGFNVFGPIVWHGRGATWPSAYAEWDCWLKV